MSLLPAQRADREVKNGSADKFHRKRMCFETEKWLAIACGLCIVELGLNDSSSLALATSQVGNPG